MKITCKTLSTSLRRFVPITALIGIIAFSGTGAFAQAQQVPIPEEPSTQPQIEVAGTGVATLDLGRSRNALSGGGRSSGDQINLSDSSLVLGAAQRLYHGGIGSFTFGQLTADEVNSGHGTPFFLHQGFVDYQNRDFETYIGRTDQPNAQIVQFPTLRGEDLIAFTNLLNPFSDGNNVEEHRYSNVAAATVNQGLRTFENFHVQHLINSSGAIPGDSGLNSYGMSIQRLGPPTLEAIQKVVSYGAGYEYRSVGKSDGGSSQAVYAGGVINLKPSLNNLVDLRVLDTYTFGNSLSTFGSVTDSFRANSNAIAASLRYLHSPFGMPASQVSLTVGYKNYPKIANANSYGVALTGVKRLGQGFDAVAQYIYQRRDGALGAVYGAREEKAVQIGLIFNFNATFNRSVGPRRTLLNLQHQYIPD